MEQWFNNVCKSNGVDNTMLEIKDINKLKVTKVKDNRLHFKYDGVRYFVMANYDCGDQWFTLYRKQFIDGKCIVDLITTSGWTFADIDLLLDKKVLSKNNIVYSHIDKVHLISKLKEFNLIV